MVKKITIILGLEEARKSSMVRWSTLFTEVYGGCTVETGIGMYKSIDGGIIEDVSIRYTVYIDERVHSEKEALDIAKQMCQHHKQECVLYTIEDVERFRLIEG